MSKVPVGLGTQVGYSSGVAGVVLAIVAYVTGDHSQANVAVIVAGASSALLFAVTTIGRMWQASVKAPPPAVVVHTTPVVAAAETQPEQSPDAEGPPPLNEPGQTE